MNGQTNTILLGVIAVLLSAQVLIGMTAPKVNTSVRPASNATTTESNPQQASADPVQMDFNNNADQMEAAATPEFSGPTTSISFTKTNHDFGTLKEGIRVNEKFKFTNTGSEPLIITNAKGSCGCTVPDYPRNPIPPGGTGEIVVEYNSTNRSGNVTNTVTITANTQPAETTLRISANVVKES